MVFIAPEQLMALRLWSECLLLLYVNTSYMDIYGYKGVGGGGHEPLSCISARITCMGMYAPTNACLPDVQGEWKKGYETVLDSGTTFSYIPRDAFRALKAAISQHASLKGLRKVPGPDPKVTPPPHPPLLPMAVLPTALAILLAVLGF